MIEPWAFIESASVLNRPHVKVEHWTFDTGSSTRGFDVLVEPSSIVVFAMTDAKEVLLLNHFFISDKAVRQSFVAGCIDTDDANPLVCAKRELMEEAGCTAREWVNIGSVLRDKWETGSFTFFLATGVEKTGTVNHDPGEHMETVFVSLAEFKEKLFSNSIHDTAVALCAYKALHYLGEL